MPPLGTLGQYRDGYWIVFARLADPLEVHAVGIEEVAAPREACLRKMRTTRQSICGTQPWQFGDGVRVERLAPGVAREEPSCVPTIAAEPGAEASAVGVRVGDVDRAGQAGVDDLVSAAVEVGPDRDVARARRIAGRRTARGWGCTRLASVVDRHRATGGRRW